MGEEITFKKQYSGLPWWWNGKEPALQNWECGVLIHSPRSWDLPAWATKPMHHNWTACMNFNYTACVPQPEKPVCRTAGASPLRKAVVFSVTHCKYLCSLVCILIMLHLSQLICFPYLETQSKFFYPTSLTPNPMLSPCVLLIFSVMHTYGTNNLNDLPKVAVF